MNGVHAARHDTLWRRLPWTGPLALLVWALAFWALALFIAKAPAMPVPAPPIEARFIELPEPPAPPVVRIDAPPVQRARQRAVSVAASAPATAQPAGLPAPDGPQSPELQVQDASQSSGLPARDSRQGQTDGLPNGRPDSTAHPGATVREESVGVIQRPLPLSIHNEDRPFDMGLGEGVSLGGWMQEVNEDCNQILGMEGPCSGPHFSQPARPWCHDANPVYDWDGGSCKTQHDKAVAAYKRNDYAAAFAGFKILAEKDYAPAQSDLAAMYAEGIEVAKDEAQAVYWWRKSAVQGDARAAYNLALMYSDGRGVPRNDQQAVFWYGKAAYFGYANAQYNLGVMHALGIGTPKNDKQAVYWYRKAADRGHATAQYNLGVMYAEGTGTLKDDKLAVYWYCKASGRGDANARSSLILMISAGNEAPKQEELLYFCWLLSSAKRSPETAYKDRALYIKTLTPEQNANAEAAARIWKPR